MPVISMGITSVFDRLKMTTLPLYTILTHFRPFWMGTFSKMTGNFKILAKALVFADYIRGNKHIPKSILDLRTHACILVLHAVCFFCTCLSSRSDRSSCR